MAQDHIPLWHWLGWAHCKQANVMVPTRLAEPQVWAPTGITASGITTGTTGRPTTGRLDTGSASGTVAVRPTGSTSSTVAVRPTSGTVRVLVRPTGSIVRVPEYEYYEHLYRIFVQVREFVQAFGTFVRVIRIRALYRWHCRYCIPVAEYFVQVLVRIQVQFRYCIMSGWICFPRCVVFEFVQVSL